MRITEKSPLRDIRDKAIRLYWMRFYSVIALFCAYFAAARLGGFEADLGPLFVLGAIEIFVNVPFPYLLRNSESAYKFLAASVMVDFAVETLAVHFIGGVDAMFFSAIYLLSILYCAMYLPSVLNFLMATLAAVFYSGLIAAEYFGVIPHRATIGIELSGLNQVTLVISHIAFFYLIAIFAHYFSNALTTKEVRMKQLLLELREASHKIKYAHRIKSEFIAHVSHELKTPLNSILGFSSLLTQPEIGPINMKQREFVDSITRNCHHLLELINDVLDLSKLEAKKAVMHWELVRIADLIRQSMDIFYEEAQRKHIQLSFEEYHASDFQMAVDVRKTRQILYNLLSNALKFTPVGGKVTAILRRTKDAVEISVCDNGIGIAPEDQERIFNPYEQAGKQSSEMLGTGLGLAITKQFVELHGGDIHVESALGAGSRFILRFPPEGTRVFPALKTPLKQNFKSRAA